MIAYRVVRYAESQARIRARLGSMPDMKQWWHIAQAGDLNHMIERMRIHGLGFWLSGLPREPDTLVIEEHLRKRAACFIDELQRLLPKHWSLAREWLRLLPNLLTLRLLLHYEKPSLPHDLDIPLQNVASLPLDQRLAALKHTAYAPLVSFEASPESLWLEQFMSRLPGVSGWEAAMLTRIKNILKENLIEIEQSRLSCREAALSNQQMANRETTTKQAPDSSQWLLRDQLFKRLHALLAGDPFHVGMILIYGLLEGIQFERLRGLLLARSQHWEMDIQLWAHA